MVEAEGECGEAASWYPEVVEAGDAPRAWQSVFDRLGMPLRVQELGGLGSRRVAMVENGQLSARLQLSSRERQFYLALRHGRATQLQGHATDLTMAAGAARLWLSGERPGRVAAAWPFLGSVALAEAREHGDRREASWLWLYENHCADPVATRLAAFVALAFREPRLRALRPYTSHFALRFSSTPQWPFSGTYPVIVPTRSPGGYVVRTRDGLVYDETDAAGALRLVLADLQE